MRLVRSGRGSKGRPWAARRVTSAVRVMNWSVVSLVGGGALKRRAAPYGGFSKNDGLSAIFTHNNNKLNRQKNYKKLYVYGSFFSESSPSSAERPSP